MNINNNLNVKYQSKRITIKDIARLSGVSVATVSLVLNNRKGVSKETRFRVQAIAEKLNYTPSALARGLVTQKTKTIGLIVSDITDPFYAELVKGVEDSAFNMGYSLILCNSDNQANKERLYINLLIEQHVAGLILVPVVNDTRNLEVAIKTNTPIVLADRKLQSNRFSSVTCDNFGGASKAVEHLVQLGHKRIGCVASFDLSFSTCSERVAAYKKKLNDMSLPVDESLIVLSNGKISGGIQSATKLLALSRPPTAIFAISDIVAFGVIEAVLDAGLRIPDDISVVGFDNIHYSEFFRVPLTTVDQPKYEMGEKVFSVLLKKIFNNVDEQVVMDTKLIIRESSGVCKSNY